MSADSTEQILQADQVIIQQTYQFSGKFKIGVSNVFRNIPAALCII